MISLNAQADGWTYHVGPNGCCGADHKSGWQIMSVGGGGHKHRFLLWTPRHYPPDASWTCYHRKTIHNADGTTRIFDSIDDAIKCWKDTYATQFRRIRTVTDVKRMRRVRR